MFSSDVLEKLVLGLPSGQNTQKVSIFRAGVLGAGAPKGQGLGSGSRGWCSEKGRPGGFSGLGLRKKGFWGGSRG